MVGEKKESSSFISMDKKISLEEADSLIRSLHMRYRDGSLGESIDSLEHTFGKFK